MRRSGVLPESVSPVVRICRTSGLPTSGVFVRDGLHGGLAATRAATLTLLVRLSVKTCRATLVLRVVSSTSATTSIPAPRPRSRRSSGDSGMRSSGESTSAHQPQRPNSVSSALCLFQTF